MVALPTIAGPEAPTATRRSTNPVLPGFHPDPSITRGADAYYLVTSSFEYLPGIPVYRSTDLDEWHIVGNVIDRAEQLDLSRTPVPGGVWAPTIRFHDGRYYVIVSVMFEARCLLFTAQDPSGPWSDPTTILGIEGIDPDLAWGDDGIAYVTFARLGTGILQSAVDLETGTTLEEPRALWSGSGLYAPEGPHIYRRDDGWILLVAEGGTERGHAVSVARGDSLKGPFVGDTTNPILSARSTGSGVQNVGHADMVATEDGRTVMVALGVRPVGPTRSFSPLGRETFLTEVDWIDGWPRPRAIEPGEQAAHALEVTFDSPDVLQHPGWVSVRQLPADVGRVDVAARVMIIDAGDLPSAGPGQAMIGWRQRHVDAKFSTTVDACGGVGGLVVRVTDDLWIALEAESTQTGTRVMARAALAGFEKHWQHDFRGGPVELTMEFAPPRAWRPGEGSPPSGGDRVRLTASAGDESVELANLDGRYWSIETSEAFTGRVVGMYSARGNVRFERFAYDGKAS